VLFAVLYCAQSSSDYSSPVLDAAHRLSAALKKSRMAIIIGGNITLGLFQ
jgi:hypothetical protein